MDLLGIPARYICCACKEPPTLLIMSCLSWLRITYTAHVGVLLMRKRVPKRKCRVRVLPSDIIFMCAKARYYTESEVSVISCIE